VHLDGDWQKRETCYISTKVTSRGCRGPRLDTVRTGLCQGAQPSAYVRHI